MRRASLSLLVAMSLGPCSAVTAHASVTVGSKAWLRQVCTVTSRADAGSATGAADFLQCRAYVWGVLQGWLTGAEYMAGYGEGIVIGTLTSKPLQGRLKPNDVQNAKRVYENGMISIFPETLGCAPDIKGQLLTSEPTVAPQAAIAVAQYLQNHRVDIPPQDDAPAIVLKAVQEKWSCSGRKDKSP